MHNPNEQYMHNPNDKTSELAGSGTQYRPTSEFRATTGSNETSEK